MKIVDVNILLYVVNKDDPFHATISRWWKHTLSSHEPVGLAWLTLVGFIRIATNSKVFTNPQTPEQAVERVTAWLNRVNVRLIKESNEHWQVLQKLLVETGTAGNLTTDAHLAALAITRGATLVSCDADFSRFRQLRWENPVT